MNIDSKIEDCKVLVFVYLVARTALYDDLICASTL
jgi:hypothetical protein